MSFTFPPDFLAGKKLLHKSGQEVNSTKFHINVNNVSYQIDPKRLLYWNNKYEGERNTENKQEVIVSHIA